MEVNFFIDLQLGHYTVIVIKVTVFDGKQWLITLVVNRGIAIPKERSRLVNPAWILLILKVNIIILEVNKYITYR